MQKRYMNASILALLLFFLPSCTQNSDTVAISEKKTPADAVKGDPKKGKAIYEKYCFYCHGKEGRGDGAIAIAISPHPADFVGDKKRMAKSDDELFQSISEGIYKNTGAEEMAMPRWKDILSEAERWDVLAYIRELSKKGE